MTVSCETKKEVEENTKSKLSKIIEDISNTETFHTNVTNFKLIVGLKKYSETEDKKQNARPLTLSSKDYSGTKYEYVNGKVAFITANHAFPCSQTMIMGLLFAGISNGDEILVQMRDSSIPMENLVKYLYNKGFVFINKNDINAKNFTNIYTNVSDVLYVGYENGKLGHYKKKLQNLTFKAGKAIHPSAKNFYDYRYHETWFEYKDDYIKAINNTSVKLEHFQVK